MEPRERPAVPLPASTDRSRATGHAASLPASRVRVGIAGWSYPDWKGTFYPASPGREFSELRHAAELFDVVEINSSFYRVPARSHCERWARTVADLEHFRFTAKLTREITHESPSETATRAICRQVVEAFAPLTEADRLAAVVAQFPFFVTDGTELRDRLALVREELSPLALVVEVRHPSFLDSSERGALVFFERHGIHFANIDLPRARGGLPRTCVHTGSTAYWRLHGRNDTAWFRRRAPRDEKYDYLYSATELADLVPSILKTASRTQVTYVITNNHFRGQAPANALELAAILTGRTRPAPPALVATYPRLAGLAELTDRASPRATSKDGSP